ncbi:MAG: hypothetical protein AAGD01_07090 [Acidobacteriota bacterium]
MSEAERNEKRLQELWKELTEAQSTEAERRAEELASDTEPRYPARERQLIALWRDLGRLGAPGDDPRIVRPAPIALLRQQIARQQVARQQVARQRTVRQRRILVAALLLLSLGAALLWIRPLSGPGAAVAQREADLHSPLAADRVAAALLAAGSERGTPLDLLESLEGIALSDTSRPVRCAALEAIALAPEDWLQERLREPRWIDDLVNASGSVHAELIIVDLLTRQRTPEARGHLRTLARDEERSELTRNLAREALLLGDHELIARTSVGWRVPRGPQPQEIE